jgi:hypothetical protein
MPVNESQDPAAMLRDRTADIVAAVKALEESRQLVAESAMALAELVDEARGPLSTLRLSVDAEMDLSRRARGIASDAGSGESDISLDDLSSVLRDAAELQDLVEFFLSRSIERAVA